MKFLAFQSYLPIIKKNKYLTKTNLVNPLPGVEVGIPLTIYENIFTNLHYGYDITTPKILALNIVHK